MARKSSRRWIWIVLVLLIVSLLTARAMGWLGGEDVPVVELRQSEKRTIIAQVSESGVIQPVVEVPIASDNSGEIVQVYVKEGQYVQRGDLLFEIQPEDLQAVLEQNQASLNTARADLASAKANVLQRKAAMVQDSINLERNRKLYEQKAIPRQEFEQFELSYETSRSAWQAAVQSKEAAFYRVENAEAAVRRAQVDLSRTRVYATMNGVVTALNIKVGQRVVGTGMMAGTEALKIADLSQMEVQVEINENDIVHVKKGDTARIEIDAYPERTFKGVVTEIGYAVADAAALEAADQVTNYPVRVLIRPESYMQDKTLMAELEDYQSPFRPGMSAMVDIYTRRADNVVAVPIQAVTLDRESGRQNPDEVVFRYDSTTQTVESMKVETGLSDDDWIELSSGLAAGQQVVAGPYTVLTRELESGAEVEVMEEKDEEDEEKKGQRKAGRKSE